jgi:hypothetical protein
MPSWVSESIDSWMNGAWSKTTVNVAPVDGRFQLRHDGLHVRGHSTVFAAGTLVTEIVSAGSPFTREMLDTGFSTSSTGPRRRSGPGPPVPTDQRQCGQVLDRAELRARLNGQRAVVLR